MSLSWSAYLDDLKSTKGFVQADDIKRLIDEARKDPLGFLMVQGEMVEMYLEQLASHEIDVHEFEASVKAIHDLIQIESVKMSPEALARAERLMKGIETLILNSLLPAITP